MSLLKRGWDFISQAGEAVVSSVKEVVRDLTAHGAQKRQGRDGTENGSAGEMQHSGNDPRPPTKRRKLGASGTAALDRENIAPAAANGLALPVTASSASFAFASPRGGPRPDFLSPPPPGGGTTTTAAREYTRMEWARNHPRQDYFPPGHSPRRTPTLGSGHCSAFRPLNGPQARQWELQGLQSRMSHSIDRIGAATSPTPPAQPSPNAAAAAGAGVVDTAAAAVADAAPLPGSVFSQPSADRTFSFGQPMVPQPSPSPRPAARPGPPQAQMSAASTTRGSSFAGHPRSGSKGRQQQLPSPQPQSGAPPPQKGSVFSVPPPLSHGFSFDPAASASPAPAVTLSSAGAGAASLPSAAATGEEISPRVDDDSFAQYKAALASVLDGSYTARQAERRQQEQQLREKMKLREMQWKEKEKRGRAAEAERIRQEEHNIQRAHQELHERQQARESARREEQARRKQEEAEVAAMEEEDEGEGEDEEIGSDDDDDDDDDDDEEEDEDIHHMMDYEGDEAVDEEAASGGDRWISAEDRQHAEQTLDEGNESEVLKPPVAPMNIPISRKDLRCLLPGCWLNDEVINVWMGHLMESNAEAQGELPKIYIMKTNFYSRMCVKHVGGVPMDTWDYPGVRRWTKKVDVFAMDYVIIPLHQQMHWALAVVNFKRKRIQYFDSLGGSPNKWLDNVKKWVEAESQHKKEQPMDWSGWDCGGEGGLDEGGLDKTMVHEQCPTQHNGFDCGVFMCQNARHVASHAEPADFPFSQQDMPSIRWQMVHEILNGALSN